MGFVFTFGVAIGIVGRPKRGFLTTPRVVILESVTPEEVLQYICGVGHASGVSEQSQNTVGLLQARVDAVIDCTTMIADRLRVVLLDWIDPPFCSEHWSPEQVRMAGDIETVGGPANITGPCSIIACCGFDVEKTLQDLAILVRFPSFESISCVRSRNVYVVDGPDDGRLIEAQLS